MSKLEANQVDPSTGTTLTLGTSGDTISIPSGVTIANSGTATGFGGTSTPAFEAYPSGTQTISADSWTKLNFATERFDTDGKYDASTSKFTPTVSGNYFIFGGAYLNSEANANLEIAQVMIYKNGSVVSGAFAEINYKTNPIYQGVYSISTIIDLDSDDYVELYGQIEASDGTGGISNAGTLFSPRSNWITASDFIP